MFRWALVIALAAFAGGIVGEALTQFGALFPPRPARLSAGVPRAGADPAGHRDHAHASRSPAPARTIRGGAVRMRRAGLGRPSPTGLRVLGELSDLARRGAAGPGPRRRHRHHRDCRRPGAGRRRAATSRSSRRGPGRRGRRRPRPSRARARPPVGRARCHRPRRSAAARTRNSEPPPSRALAHRRPPIARTSWSHTNNPSPAPLACWAVDGAR